MSVPLVLFHASCADGFCAAWVAHRKFGEAAEYVPVQYGQDPPDVGQRNVYILDFSYKRDVLLEMATEAASIVVLDHHKTAAVELLDVSDETLGLHVVFDMTKSGGRLTWEHFHPGSVSASCAPWLVNYTEDRDLWRWKLDWSREISAFIASHPFDFRLWDGWSLTPPGCPAWDRFVDAGSAILRYQSQQVEAAVSHAVEVEMDGHKILAVNATTLISETAGKLAEGKAFGACYFIRGDGKRVWSLRSREGGIDVSEIARKRGGGGHHGAAGYTE